MQLTLGWIVLSAMCVVYPLALLLVVTRERHLGRGWQNGDKSDVSSKSAA